MPVRAFAFAVLSVLCPACARAGDVGREQPDLRLGAVFRKDGELCFRTANADAAARPGVVIVFPDTPGAVFQGVVTGRRAGCAEEGDLHGYSLRLQRGTPGRATEDGGIGTGPIGVGALVPASSVSFRDGVASVRLPGEPRPVSLRLCTSLDGVHLTGWYGPSLSADRAWHSYVYVGQDLKPTCTTAETQQ